MRIVITVRMGPKDLLIDTSTDLAEWTADLLGYREVTRQEKIDALQKMIPLLNSISNITKKYEYLQAFNTNLDALRRSVANEFNVEVLEMELANKEGKN